MRLPQPAPTLSELVAGVDLNSELPAILDAIPTPEERGEYWHWEDVRRQPPPAGITRKQRWLGLKFRRGTIARQLPLVSATGERFTYGLTDAALESLHWIDQHSAGEILISEGVTEPAEQKRYLVNGLMEESITSSQLEGASVTRKVAKDMLRSGRAPRDRSERMILNNYRAMTLLSDLAQSPLTPEIVFDLHRILTEGTLDDPAAAGRPQQSGEERVRVFDSESHVVHVPPPAEELTDRMAAMVEFANGNTPDSFVHPVVRAILLHLWLAYDHPFEDGNGRTARALFYWEMLQQGYWVFEYLSISSLLLKAPAQYARAFLHTEADQFDATYFILHQLKVIRRAVDELMAYLRRKASETRRTVSLLRTTTLNHRQVALMTHALRHPGYEYTISSHAKSHGVVRQSARTDLLDLEARGYLTRRAAGRKFYFYAIDDLQARLVDESGERVARVIG